MPIIFYFCSLSLPSSPPYLIRHSVSFPGTLARVLPRVAAAELDFKTAEVARQQADAPPHALACLAAVRRLPSPRRCQRSPMHSPVQQPPRGHQRGRRPKLHRALARGRRARVDLAQELARAVVTSELTRSTSPAATPLHLSPLLQFFSPNVGITSSTLLPRSQHTHPTWADLVPSISWDGGRPESVGIVGWGAPRICGYIPQSHRSALGCLSSKQHRTIPPYPSSSPQQHYLSHSKIL